VESGKWKVESGKWKVESGKNALERRIVQEEHKAGANPIEIKEDE
jgi:hypothetical protein